MIYHDRHFQSSHSSMYTLFLFIYIYMISKTKYFVSKYIHRKLRNIVLNLGLKIVIYSHNRYTAIRSHIDNNYYYLSKLYLSINVVEHKKEQKQTKICDFFHKILCNRKSKIVTKVWILRNYFSKFDFRFGFFFRKFLANIVCRMWLCTNDIIVFCIYRYTYTYAAENCSLNFCNYYDYVH